MPSVTPPTTPTPAEVMADVAKRQLVHRICTAYESGIGRGLSGRDLAQPYEPTCGEGIAYENGWYEGRRRHMQSVTPPGPAAYRNQQHAGGGE